MNNKTNIKVLSGMLIALGVLIPYLLGHAFGLRGVFLLPMHFPVLVCGLTCGPLYGLLCGIITPVLSSVLTGMPSAFPMLPVLICELAILGFVSGWTYRVRQSSIYLSLSLSVMLGRIANGCLLAFLLSFKNGELVILTAIYSVLKGIPGIIIQLITVPFLAKLIEIKINKFTGIQEKDSLSLSPLLLEQVRNNITSGVSDCILIKNNEIVDEEKGRGISPLITIYKKRKKNLRESIVVDKVIGKAAAMICVSAGVREVFAEVISVPAARFLKEKNVPRSWDILSQNIKNRKGDGICPMEFSVLDEDNTKKGVNKILATFEKINKLK
ncbi:MAG: DUF1893 domain-containing protein [Synergistaceae bacterium]|nr:DUF1893 domain-containing protein [Synergistaceae bacterium]